MAAATLEPLDPDALFAEPERWDALARTTPHIDAFCSTTPWMLAADRGLTPGRSLFFARSDTAAMALAEHRLPDGRTFWEPLESMWGFGSPAVGADLDAALAGGLSALAAAHPWRAVILTGQPLARAPIPWHAAAAAPGSTVRMVAQARRRVASLEGGFQGYLARRSAGFRNNLARAHRRAQTAGLSIAFDRSVSSEAGANAALDRAVAIETQSWKGKRAVGIDTGNMQQFYRHMLPPLAARGALRLVWVSLDGRDVAYHFGAVLDQAYRGLQHSFVDELRPLSPGVLAHAAAIEAACDEGLLRYDLGQETPYKARWAETTFVTATMLVLR